MIDTKSESVIQCDLNKQSVKLARRLQALPDGRAYNLVLLKCGQLWMLVISDDEGKKVERIEA